MSSTHKASGFVEYLCAVRSRVLVLHTFLWLGVVLNTMSLFLASLPSAATTVTMMNYAGLFVLLLVTGAILLKCRDE